MKIKKIINLKKCVISVYLIFLNIPLYSANISINNESKRVRIFYSQDDITGWDAVAIGYVLSLGMREEASEEELEKLARDKTKITVRLFKKEEINNDEDIFVIDEKNLIVARFKVKTQLHSKSFGHLLVGYGNFRLVSRDFRVVLRKKSYFQKDAYIYKSRGDFFKSQNDISSAITQYEKAVNVDSSYPEAHIELGFIYLEKNIVSYADKEFNSALKYYNKIVDKNDKFNLLLGLIKTYYILAYESGFSKGNTIRNNYIKKGLKYSKRALELNDKSEEVIFYTGYFYYNNPSPDDLMAKKLMLKSISLNPKRVESYIVLSRLYFKYKNKEKAIYYAELAKSKNPGNKKIDNLLKLIKNYNK